MGRAASKGSRRVVLGGVAFALVGLSAGVAVLVLNEGAQKPDGASSEPKAPVAAKAKKAGGPSAEALKKLIAEMHPGMEIPDDVLEQAIDPTTLPLEERKERIARGIAAHAQENRDRGWARPQEERLTISFNMVAESSSSFELDDVECKSTTCLVKLRWAKAEQGQATYEVILGNPVAMGCQLELVPPEGGALEAVAFLDCDKAREQLEGSVPMVATTPPGPIPMKPEGSTALHSDP